VKENQNLTKEQILQRKIQQAIIPLSRLFHDQIHFTYHCDPALIRVDVKGGLNGLVFSHLLIDAMSQEINSNCRPKPKPINPLSQNNSIHKIVLSGPSGCGKSMILS